MGVGFVLQGDLMVHLRFLKVGPLTMRFFLFVICDFRWNRDHRPNAALATAR